MTDRYSSFIVVLENDLHEAEEEYTLAAIKMIKGVLFVEPNISDINTHIAYTRARHDLTNKIWDVLK